MSPREALKRFLIYVAAIASWIALWVGAMAVGLELGKAMVGPRGHEGYLAFTGMWGVLFIPMGLACGMLFLRWKRNILLFLVSAVPIGLAIMLWPFLFLWAWP